MDRIVQQSVNKGVEAETAPADLAPRIEELKSKTWLYKHFIDALVSGTWHDLPREEITRLVEEKFFSFEPLTPLDEEQEGVLRRYAIDNLFRIVNKNKLKRLVGEAHIGTEDWNPKGKTVFVSGAEARSKQPLKKMSVADKLRLFFDPNLFLYSRIEDERGSDDLKAYGNSNIVEYAYDEETIQRLIAERGRVVVLDVGSSMNLALHDLKGQYGDQMETHGFSAEEEVAMFPVDHQHYGLAERMPKEFMGKFDLIFSNMAFRYFAFQNIALRNVVKALRAGGVAELHFSYDSGPGAGIGEKERDKEILRDYFLKTTGKDDHYEAMKILVAEEMKKLEALRDQGLIDYHTNQDFYIHKNQGVLVITKLKDFAYA